MEDEKLSMWDPAKAWREVKSRLVKIHPLLVQTMKEGMDGRWKVKYVRSRQGRNGSRDSWGSSSGQCSGSKECITLTRLIEGSGDWQGSGGKVQGD
jgi:hypothetical protein